MNSNLDNILIYSPQPNATPDEIMHVLKMVFFQSYPPLYKTQERLEYMYNNLPEGAKRHFKWEQPK